MNCRKGLLVRILSYLLFLFSIIKKSQSLLSSVKFYHHDCQTSKSYVLCNERNDKKRNLNNILTTFDESGIPLTQKESAMKEFSFYSKNIAFQFGCISYALLTKPPRAKAIGSLFELNKQSMVLQDIRFNVNNANQEIESFVALFQNLPQVLRQDKNTVTTNPGPGHKLTTITSGFGPDTYDSPRTFYPGISSYFQDGGHSTLTFSSEVVVNENSDNVVTQVLDRGNGLQYIKVGIDTLRLSKGIESGMNVKYAYGWVDIDTPSGVPLQVVVGIRRDPLMFACINVSDITQSLDFFIDKLGMTVLPFPLARSVGSQFEPQQPKGSVYVGYSESSMGLLLQDQTVEEAGQKKKKKTPRAIPGPSISVGNIIEAFTIVYDDSSPAGIDNLPAFVKEVISSTNNIANAKINITSPDGYPFVFVPYSSFQKQSTKSIPQ